MPKLLVKQPTPNDNPNWFDVEYDLEDPDTGILRIRDRKTPPKPTTRPPLNDCELIARCSPPCGGGGSGSDPTQSDQSDQDQKTECDTSKLEKKLDDYLEDYYKNIEFTVNYQADNLAYTLENFAVLNYWVQLNYGRLETHEADLRKLYYDNDKFAFKYQKEGIEIKIAWGDT